jgi:hypothetical protein
MPPVETHKTWKKSELVHGKEKQILKLVNVEMVFNSNTFRIAAQYPAEG